MQVYFISILVSCTLADYSDPYPASGFRPSGPVFELPKRLANLRGTQQYGASNREYDPAKSNVNNEYSYRTINLPQNQYGLQRDQSGGGISQTRYGQTSKNTNEPHSPSYNSPRTENRLITQQQLPMFRNSNFFQQQQLLPTQYGASNYNQFDTTASGSGKSETGNYAVNNGYAKQQSGENLKSQFSNQYDAADASKRHQQNRPGSFYNSDGIDSRTSDVDLRFGSNEFNATSNNQNGFNGNAFGNRNRDRYYNTNPTVRSREEPTTIQPEPNNDSDNVSNKHLQHSSIYRNTTNPCDFFVGLVLLT